MIKKFTVHSSRFTVIRPMGQTLMELLIAAAVIGTGLFAAATIVFSNLQLSDRDSDEIVAVNLAREMIEMAKQLRDSNWLEGIPFDTRMKATVGDDYSATPRWDGKPVNDEIFFVFLADDISHGNTIVKQSSDPDTPGFFTNAAPGDPTTIWRRLVIFHPICETAGGLAYKNDGENCGTDPKIGIRVEAIVQWQRKGQTFNRVVYEDLFDWR